MNFEHLRRLLPQIRKIAQKYEIEKISVFGSVARGESTSASDLDLLVELQENASLFGVAGFGYEMEQLLGVPVDVIPLSILPIVSDQEFVRRIQKEAVPL
jgi:predicted nucleotidyltransferase